MPVSPVLTSHPLLPLPTLFLARAGLSLYVQRVGGCESRRKHVCPAHQVKVQRASSPRYVVLPPPLPSYNPSELSAPPSYTPARTSRSSSPHPYPSCPLPTDSYPLHLCPPSADTSSLDIIDETLTLFRANCLFRSFDINGPADRLLIYLTLFLSECLSKISTTNKGEPTLNEARKTLTSLALEAFALPGDASFPLNSMYAPPGNSSDAGQFEEWAQEGGRRREGDDRAHLSSPCFVTDHLRQYLTQARQELASRLLDQLYPLDTE